MIYVLADVTSTENVPRWLIVCAAALAFIVAAILPLLGVLIAWLLGQSAKIKELVAMIRDALKKSDTAVVDAAQAKTAAYANTERVADVSRKVDLHTAATVTQLGAMSLAITPNAPGTPSVESIEKALNGAGGGGPQA